MIQITCPSGAAGTPNIKVANGTMCVQGTISDGFGGSMDTTGMFVLVRVVPGFVALGLAPPPLPMQQGDGTATPSPMWLAKNVAAATSIAGTQQTVFAWLLSGTVLADGPTEQQFFGGGPRPTDCCPPGSGSGSGSGPQGDLLGGELAFGAILEVMVASGKHAGSHKATPVASGKWDLTLAGVTYVIHYAGEDLLMHGPSFTAYCTSLESDPFSATFPGRMLDADDEIVVIVA